MSLFIHKLEHSKTIILAVILNIFNISNSICFLYIIKHLEFLRAKS